MQQNTDRRTGVGRHSFGGRRVQIFDQAEATPLMVTSATVSRLTRSPEQTLTGANMPQNFVMIGCLSIGDSGAQHDPSNPNNPNNPNNPTKVYNPNNPTKVYTDLLTAQGHVARAAGAQIDRAVYHRDGSGAVVIDVFASSETGQVLQASGDAIAPTLLREHDGKYFARVATEGTLPLSVDVTNTSDTPISITTRPVADEITIERAEYDTASKTLTIEASSSDQQSPPALEAVGLGALRDGLGIFSPQESTPVEVTVTSANGGSISRIVTILGAPTIPIEAVAKPGPDQTIGLDSARLDSGV
jgi:hypothetical protein